MACAQAIGSVVIAVEALMEEREGRSDIIVVRAGTLDDTSWGSSLIAHVFVRSAQPWEKFSGDAECFETVPDNFQLLAEKWRQLWRHNE